MTKDKTRLGYVCVCVEMHVPYSFPICIKLDQGVDEFTSDLKVAHLLVEYQWVSYVYTHCCVFGHPLSRCLKNPSQP